MNTQDLDYLRAELAQAQQQGATRLLVRTAELMSLVGHLTHLLQMPKQPVKIMGYARPGEIEKSRRGKLMTMRVRRLPTPWHTEPVYTDKAEVSHDQRHP